MRAYSDNEDLALLSGVNPDRVVLVTWILAAILATIAGTLYGLDKSFKPFTYLQLLLPMFAAAIVGGIGNPIGAILGGYAIAFSEVIVTYAYKKFFIYLFACRVRTRRIDAVIVDRLQVCGVFYHSGAGVTGQTNRHTRRQSSMSNQQKTWLAFGSVGLLLLIIGFSQSWSVALGIFNLCLISAVMALGVNMQWGYAGLLNVGVMGFAALGGMAAVLVSQSPVAAAWEAGWVNLLIAGLFFASTIALAIFAYQKMDAGRHRTIAISMTLIIGLFFNALFP